MTDPIDPALLERARVFQTEELKLCDEDYCTAFDGAPCDCIKAQIALARFAMRERLEAQIEKLEWAYQKVGDEVGPVDKTCYYIGQELKALRAQRDKGGA